MYENYRNHRIRLPKQTNYIVLAYKVQAQADQTIPTGRDTIFLCNENFVYKGFRCNPSATDKPNVAVNTRQNYSSGTEST